MIQQVLVLDTSPIINALGCGAPERIFDPLAGQCVVEENTVKEVVRNPFNNKPASSIIEHLVTRGCLKVVRMGDSAYARYIELVAGEPADALGRGEGAALAYAAETGGIVVLDDRKARRIGKDRFPHCQQMSSINLFRHAAQVGRMPPKEIAALIQVALANSRMHVFDDDREWLRDLGIGASLRDPISL